jgi:LacI family gluconate utilization system Gnt-I transcriptional repressor
MRTHSRGKGSRRNTITLADVAREADVSQITVSRVIRQLGPVSEETRQRVQTVIKRIGYVPNRIAGALASARSDLIGVIFPSVSNTVFADVLRGLHDALSDRGLRVVVTVTGYNLDTEEQHVRSLLALRPAAIVLTGCEHTEATTAMVSRAGISVVEIMDTDGTAIDLAVGLSHKHAAEASATYLLRRGYRRFGYVGHESRPRDLRAWRRWTSFLAMVKAAGAAVLGEEIIAGPSSVPAGRAALKRLLTANPDIHAVYFSNDDMAIGGLFHCLAEDLAIPERLAIFGFNGLDIGQAMPKPLSTILTFRYKIGLLAGKAILARIDRAETARHTDVGFKLITGATA